MRTNVALWSGCARKAAFARWPLWTCDTALTLRSYRTDCPVCATLTISTILPRWTLLTIRAIQSGRAALAGIALGSSRADITFRTRQTGVALRTGLAVFASWPGCAILTRQTLWPSLASISLVTLGTSFTVSTGRTSRTGRTRNRDNPLCNFQNFCSCGQWRNFDNFDVVH